MFMSGAAIWAAVALWGAVAWSHPGPRHAAPLTAAPPAASASRASSEPSTRGASAAPPARSTANRRIRRWTPPAARRVRRAPVVRVLPRYVAPVTTTQTS